MQSTRMKEWGEGCVGGGGGEEGERMESEGERRGGRGVVKEGRGS